MNDAHGPPPLRRLFRFPGRSRRQIASELDEELAFHLERVAADLRRDGWSEADARREAERRFGDLEYTRTYCRGEDARREQDKRRMTFIDELGQDLRYAARSLRAAPGFTATALLTLALGIGANTAIFSVVKGVLLEPLPFLDEGRIVRAWHGNPASGIERVGFSEPDFLDLRTQTQTATSVGAYFFADGLSGVDLTGSGAPERLNAALVTDGFFQTLGTRPLLGRALLPEDHVEGRNRLVVISHGLWVRRFGADAGVVGSTITLNQEPFQLVGVMPPDFTFPADQNLDAWLPLSYFGPDQIGRARGARFLAVIARMKPGIPEPQFRTEVAGIVSRLAGVHPENEGWVGVYTSPIRDVIVGNVRRPLLVLMAAVGMLLLIACANIASLLLARATGRQRELAVRAALGAGRGRIARQLLTESLALAVVGGAAGVALGVAGVRALAATGGSEVPRIGDVRVDAAVLGFTFVVSVLSGLLFGLAPTLRASHNLERSLRAGARGSVGGAGQRLRSALVVLEVALAVVLVVGAGLATKSFARLLSVDPGFRPEHALVAMMSVGDRYGTRDARLAYYVSVLEAIRRIPGVEAAGAIRDLPLRGRGELQRPEVPGRTPGPGGWPGAQWHQISTDYFRAMAIPLRAGRTFEPTDNANAPFVVVINEELANRTWPGEDAVGKAFRLEDTELRVIGVVGDVRQNALTEPVEPAMYVHALQNFRSRMSIVVRTNGDPLRYADAVRQAIWSQDPTQTITSIMTLDAVLGRAVARPRLLAWLLAFFGIVGLTLGALGIFGVLAYTVNQQRQEIGVRVALGASPRAVLGLIVGRGMLLAGAGVVIGIAGAAFLTRSMRSVLFGIGASDPFTFAQVSIVLIAAALLASWLPARRALRIDPVAALRYD